ncbi:MAG: helicase-related protein, partial [Planctomycetota bacterium]|nr:helicase-related protein [Planctomycetota bacterium]
AYKYGDKVSKTRRYNLGEALSSQSKFLLFLTATPHRGDPENFRLLLDLLEPGFFADEKMLAESIQSKDNPLFLRRLKEDLKDFENAPIFPPRKVETVKYRLSSDEARLYNAVTEYVERHFNRALEKGKRSVTFALMLLQRRLASSVRAVRKSLERRLEKLKELYEKGRLIQVQEVEFDEEVFEDLEERERWKREEELLESLSSAGTLEELREEIENLTEVTNIAKEVEKKEVETKLTELKKVMDIKQLQQTKEKLLIFTEARDTLEYLVEKIRKWKYTVTYIHGGMNLDERIRAEDEFNNTSTQIMVSTEAGGEGINLQKRCWIMVNYDIPWNPNRLEQRMGRIHRYGQQHEVHVYNLVAVETREGRILEKLFEKLSRIKEQIGSDRVFDVIGEIIPGKNLKDLIVDVISRKRTMEEILKDFERVRDEEAIKRVREASFEALATRHIDLTRILGEQRTAKENRLIPEYIEEFFKRAAKVLNIKMAVRKDNFWHISSVPIELRNLPHEFKMRFGEVQSEYIKIGFDKDKCFKAQAEFVAGGHPLLESVIRAIQSRCEMPASEGAMFIDPEGKKDGIIWFFEIEIRDGGNEIAGKRLLAVYQPLGTTNQFSFVNPAILWDLKPCAQQQGLFTLPTDAKDAVLNFVISSELERYKAELFQNRQRNAKIKEKYGMLSIESMIAESEAKLCSYEERQAKGENVPEMTIQNERRRREELEQKRQRLKREIEAETHLYPSEPKILAAIRVVPASATGKMLPDRNIEEIGMKIALNYEESHGREPEDVHLKNLGFDIRSRDRDGRYRYIEVKARAEEGAIVLTPNEWLMAQRLKNEYYIYIVTNANTRPTLYLVQNPAEKFKPQEEIDIVRYIIKDWKGKAKKEED